MPDDTEKTAASPLIQSTGSLGLVQRVRQDAEILSKTPGFPTVTADLFEAADRIEKLEGELRNIANAKPSEWGEMSDQFQLWAQNRARHILSENAEGDSQSPDQ